MTYNGMLPNTSYLKPIISNSLSHEVSILNFFKNNQEAFQRRYCKFLNKKNKSWEITEFSVVLWSTGRDGKEPC